MGFSSVSTRMNRLKTLMRKTRSLLCMLFRVEATTFVSRMALTPQWMRGTKLKQRSQPTYMLKKQMSCKLKNETYSIYRQVRNNQ